MSKGKKKADFRLSMKLIFMLTVIVTMAASIISINSIVVPQSKEAVSKEIINNLKTALEGQSILIDEYITENELIMRQYGTAHEIRDLLLHPDDPEKQMTAQNYTEAYFANLTDWEGIYTSNWNTTVLAHSTPQVVGMTTREGDSLPPYQATMSESPDGFYDGGVFTSPASGMMILNMRQGITDDNGNYIGLVGGGPFIRGLQNILDRQKIQGFESAKYTILDSANSVYVTNADEALIGQPIEEQSHLDVLKEAEAGNVAADIEKNGKIYVWKALPDQHIVILIEDDLATALSVVKNMTNTVAVVTAVIVIVLLVAGYLASTIISRPLISISESMKKLSEGYLRNEIAAKSVVKEMQDIIDAAKTLQSGLISIVDNIKHTSSDLAGSVVDTSELCASSASGAAKISQTVDELSASTATIAGSVTILADNVNDISVCVDEINGAVDLLSVSSKVMGNVSEEAKEDIVNVAKSAEKSVEAVQNITNHMNELAESISEITKATELIASISSQTSLLSLNASIEAARAGEAGRGFAVVATEISQLASQSDSGTKQIDEVTRKVLELSAKSRSLTEDIAAIIDDERRKVEATQESFSKLKAEIDRSVSEINNIAAGVKKLDNAKEIASRAVHELSAVSEENAASNEQVNASIAGLSANITDISERSGVMSSMAGSLTDAIRAFKD